MSLQPQEKRRQATQDVPVKRFRVSRACDQCRNAREKCDANQPSCSPCLEARRICTYTSNPKKRGLQPGYIRTLEMTLAFIFQQNTEIESLVHDQLAQRHTVLLARGTKESNRLHKSWTKSRFCRDVTRALSGEQIGTSEDRLPSSDDDSEVDTEDATLLQMTPKPQPQHSASRQSGTSYISQETAPSSLPDLHSPSLQQSTGSSCLTPLPGDCWRLIELYCTYTQCWLPISDKLEILKLSYSYPEQGLSLSCDMSSSGSHAEMWSMFAVGSSQDDNNVSGESYRPWSPIRLYNIARQLIPDELGNFELDHVKALLNLALFNINRRLFDASWHLVGAALRISLMLAETSDVAASRRKHVMSGCFVLDSLLSLHLKRRPYLDRADLSWMGKIEEDGMEEWQPWSGHLNLGSTRQSNSPTLALSTFNALLELVDILGSTSRGQTAPNFLHEMIGRLEMWKSALPQKLEYIRKDSAFTPATPPALLLRFTYLVTAFTLVPSQAWLQQILDMLSVLQRQLGASRMPSIIACLLQSIRRSAHSLALDQPTHTRIRELFAALGQSSYEPSEEVSAGLRSVSATRRDTASDKPETMQTSPQPLVPQLRGPFVERYHQLSDPSSMVHGTVPDMENNHQGHGVPSFEPNLFDFGMAGPIFDPHDPYNALVSGDLGSFLDDFASKHGAKKLQNQPQFMENLGFSSEVSMADLLAADPGRFMPTASNIGPDNSEGSPQFPLNTFYDAG